MTQTLRPPRARPTGGVFGELSGASPLAYVGPNWFAAVMGTGIVAVAAVGLPVQPAGTAYAALIVWVWAATLLVVLCAATVAHWVRHPAAARSHLDHPVMGHFYGAPAMAFMTVGAGALAVGRPLLGPHLAVLIDAWMWTAGTAMGLATTVVVPYRAFVRGSATADAAFGGWLMPVVPPMVSAATGAALIPHLPSGWAREAMLLVCYGCFAVTVLCSLVIVPLICRRLWCHGAGAAALVPTFWIVLGPLGQSVTAVHHLGVVAPSVLGPTYGAPFRRMILLYGLPVWGLAMLWLGLVVVLTARTVRDGMPFGLPWWSFTFPVGTMVTGTSALAKFTGSEPLTVVACLLFAGLVIAWVTVTVRTARGVWSGRLLAAPAQVTS
ncbi:TDT family transporter [Allobranchiibius huperziae]|uniref:C4-dicarboxylate transporter/malic acid transport protein n=1 Tax=Allobranchiibius huperziae TaxID=1874116 RepID=A0A853DKI2_9MICO|nr:TDT family transporter [Allobranchiibius huperziae]NYJ74665.1 C4-dicarboxylate transporter/malic acid transport protein [Allobranchiibius huperziae]